MARPAVDQVGDWCTPIPFGKISGSYRGKEADSIATSRCRSAWESLPSSAASRVSPSPWSSASTSLLWAASRVPAFAFSPSLVQALVQASEGIAVSPLIFSLVTVASLLPKLVVAVFDAPSPALAHRDARGLLCSMGLQAKSDDRYTVTTVLPGKRSNTRTRFGRRTHGRPLKRLSIVDEYTRECLALEVERSITSRRWSTCQRSCSASAHAKAYSQRQQFGVHRRSLANVDRPVPPSFLDHRLDHRGQETQKAAFAASS